MWAFQLLYAGFLMCLALCLPYLVFMAVMTISAGAIAAVGKTTAAAERKHRQWRLRVTPRTIRRDVRRSKRRVDEVLNRTKRQMAMARETRPTVDRIDIDLSSKVPFFG